MNLAAVFRFLSVCMLGVSVAALIVGNGALAQNTPQSVQNPPPGAIAPNIPASQVGSNTNALNWAGYVATGGTYTSVLGSWTVPSVEDGTAGNVADATWVGIGGVVSTDLIQAGTEAIPDSGGGLTYQAWYETLPQDSVTVPISISPGDSVSVSITQLSQDEWDISFDDATTGETYQKTVEYDSSLSSADWVEEMPVEVGGVIGLDDFGTVDFTSAYAIKNGEPVTVQSSGATPLTMDNAEGVPVATPSALGADGSSFSVSRTTANSTPLALSPDGVSAVAVGSPYSFESGGYGSGYSVHIHRGRGFERIVIQF